MVRGTTVYSVVRNEALKVWKFGKVQMPQNAWTPLSFFFFLNYYTQIEIKCSVPFCNKTTVL